jgi:hypothetical protein
MKGFFKSRLVLTLVTLVLMAGALAVSLASISHSRPALAYGKENWQIAFASTGVAPGTGGSGFWGWCTFGGGVISGNNGDCEFSQYFHAPSGGGFTCEESLDITSWEAKQLSFPFVSFVIDAATATVHPTSLTGPCLELFPGPAGFPFDTGFPAKAGHYNFGPLVLGLRGTLQVQVVQIQ